MRSTRELEQTAIATVLIHATGPNYQGPTLDPDIFQTKEAADLVRGINEHGPYVENLQDALRNNPRAREYHVEIVANCTEYAYPLDFLDRIILEKLRQAKRAAIVNGAALEAAALCAEREPEQALGVLRDVFQAPLPGGTQKPVSANSEAAGVRYLERLQQINSPEGLPGQIKTGIPLFDEGLNQSLGGGLHLGQIGCIAARPGRGKTTMMIYLLEALLYENPEESAAVFSFEMTHEDIAGGILKRSHSRAEPVDLNLESRIPPDRQGPGRGPLNNFQAAQALDRSAELLARLYVDERPSSQVEEMIAEADRLQEEHGTRVFLVDYVQRVNVGEDVSPDNLRVAYGEIVLALTEDAKTKDRAWIILSQFSRSAEGRPPVMADLKETSAIEENAVWILGLHRPHQENANPPRLDPYRLQVFTLKNRFGGMDTHNLLADWAGGDFQEDRGGAGV